MTSPQEATEASATPIAKATMAAQAADSAAPYEPRCCLLTGGAGFMYASSRVARWTGQMPWLTSPSTMACATSSGSHVLERLVRRFPQCHFYNLDKLDYCSTDHNLGAIKDAPNYTFVRVRTPPAVARDPLGCRLTHLPANSRRHARHPQGSITSPDLVSFLFRDKKIDTVMHFAAQSHVGTFRYPWRCRPSEVG